MGLDATLSQTLSLVTSPLIDGIQQGNIGTQLVKIIPSLTKDFTLYGIDKLGTSLGLDPRVSSLIGAPIAAGIGAQTSYSLGLNIGQSVIQSINQGLIQGATSLGIDYLTQKANLDPLVGSVTSRAVAGAIAGALNGGDIFGGIYQSFKDSALNVARLGVSGTDSWSQAQYLQREINFSTIIKNKGLAQALEDSAAQILREDAVSSILQSFGSVKAFIQDAITNNKFKQVTISGSLFKELTWGDQGQYSIDLANDYSDVTRVKMGNEIFQGTYGNVDNIYGLLKGSINDQSGGFTQFQTIENGQQTYAEIKDSTGKTVLVVSPNQSGGFNTYDSFGQYLNANIFSSGSSISLSNGISSMNQSGFKFANDTDFTWLTLQGLSKNDLSNFAVVDSLRGDGSNEYSLRWVANSSTLIPQNWIDALKSPGAVERVSNAFQGFGFRTNLEIMSHFDSDSAILSTSAKTGTIISVQGRGFSSDIIKAGTGGSFNHTATLYVDNQGNRWVIQEKGPLPWDGLEKVKLADWLTQYRNEQADINVGALTAPGVDSDLKNSIERNLFYWNVASDGTKTLTDQVINMPYDSLNAVAGLHVPGWNICSSLIVQIYKDSGHPLFELFDTDLKYRYTPSDVYRRLKLLGYTD